MKQFLYLFRGGDQGFSTASPEEIQAHMGRWTEWMTRISPNDQPVAGTALDSSGKVVKDSGQIISDGPFTEGKEIVGGYVLVQARDIDHAAELSKDCPIFEFGGFVEVRPSMSE
ncbi:MAG: hypothetical protein ACI8QD_001668 [Cyclobacteriaceae bacterium]|jgi:hypothetical protein